MDHRAKKGNGWAWMKVVELFEVRIGWTAPAKTPEG
jgi:hypothetical protein